MNSNPSHQPPSTAPRVESDSGPLWLPGNPRLRLLTLMAMDAILLTGGLAIIFFLYIPARESGVPGRYTALYLHVVAPIVGLRIALLDMFGLYRSISRHAGVSELRMILRANSIVTLLVITFNFFTEYIESLGTFPRDLTNAHILRIPWGIVFSDWMFALITVGGVRLLRRELALGFFRMQPQARKRVVVVGAGDAGGQVARDLEQSTRGAFRPVAFVDSDPALAGRMIHGLPVAGKIEDLPRVIKDFEPEAIVIALQKPTPNILRKILDDCQSARVELKIVPPLTSVMTGGIEISTLRPVEIEDLLGREPVDLQRTDRPTYLRGKRVLVTGAGGSIGLELCRQALDQKPASIALLGRGENSVFEALVELKPLAEKAGVRLQSIVGDIRDLELVDHVVETLRPQVVFHAAAHKHVHFMEAQPAEAVKNNILGTLNMAEAAAGADVERFILISTDKAVRPTGFMGASKRVGELIVSSLNERTDAAFVSVRFGNVLGSRGSVIPTFRRQIEQGGPVTVTHPDVTRYFMTASEAVSLVIQAGAQGRGGELYILDMGEPVRIADLARNLITLSGLEPETDIPITFTGLRPGEKLTEELLTRAEGVTATEHGKIFITRNEAPPWKELRTRVVRLAEAAEANNTDAIRAILKELIRDFHPREK